MQALTDGSRLMTEALVKAGADVFIGYPITPANLLYAYSKNRFKTFLAAPDEITTLQWMSGFSISGKLPVTATSFPGFALMLESINMAYMMELPMVIVLVQRLGPSTGTATCGAQGDLSLLSGMLSGGYSIPVIATSNAHDCWTLADKAIKTANRLRTPVILLTSKEEAMTQFSFDLDLLESIAPVERKFHTSEEPYIPYKRDDDEIPEFLPVSTNKHQVRITASTHNEKGILEGITPAALKNTLKINEKIEKNLASYLFYELDEHPHAETLLVSWGVTANATREAAMELRKNGTPVSFFLPKTLLPLADVYAEILNRYKKIVFAEENHPGQLKKLIYGFKTPSHVHAVNKIGQMIDPQEIIEEVKKHG
ncbi:MAG: hypothetical protein K9G58_03975 [Bacteroidales bacterium]|nr:hypothetical protein [Bacteroidales bacterium]MCF8388569.1 hypothetical protein [Bacteroidales bacterium]MCF8397301.1 hypothetical protein [Bacteroidales bacterium]